MKKEYRKPIINIYPGDRKYTASKNYMLREIAGDAVLISVGAGVADFCGVISLNSSAAALWRCLEKGCTQAEAAEELLAKYPVEREQAIQDVYETFKMLEERKMVSYE